MSEFKDESIHVQDAVADAEDESTQTRRERRISDYINGCMAKADPFEASLGAVNGDLMLIAGRLGQCVADTLQQPPNTIAELSELAPGLETYYRLTKQLDRMSQLAMRLEKMHRDD